MKKLITQKESLKESIPLISLMCAICGIMIAFVTYLPVSTIIFTFLIPLPSIIISLYTKSKYYFIYFMSCFTICCLVGAGDIGYAISSILPSLIVAFVIGFLIKKKFSIYYTFIISSIVLFLFNLISLYFLIYIFNINIIEIISDLLNIQTNESYSFLTISIIYLYSLIQTFLILLVSLDQIKFLIKDALTKKSYCLIEASTSLIFTLASLISFPFSYDFGYLFLFIALFSTLYLITFNAKTMLKSIIFGISIVFTWILYIILLPHFDITTSFCLLNLIPLINALFVIIYTLVVHIKEDKNI